MANTKSAAKSARQSLRRRARNAAATSALKGQQKKVRKALASGDASAKSEFQKLSSALDKAAKRGTIHRNVANRRKARLNRALSAAAAK